MTKRNLLDSLLLSVENFHAQLSNLIVNRIHNYTINIANNEEKFYYYNASFDCLEKHSKKGIERQFSLSRLPADLSKLQTFLGWDIQLDDIYVDTYDFQSDSYWLMTEDTTTSTLIQLYQVLLEKYKVSESNFLYWAGYLNNLIINNLEECAQKKCIACIRLPLSSNRLKIYARPFRYHSFDVAPTILQKVKEILQCDEESLQRQINAGGVSYDFSDGRVVFFTQNDALKQLR